MEMHFYRNRIYPFLVDAWGDPPPIQEIRQKIISLANGTVLEIGVGSGANFPYYDPAKVRKLYALEPNPGMIKLAKRKAHPDLNIEFIGLPGERIPLDDEMIDTVVSTFTLCTIPGIKEAIQGIARVMKANGKLIFFELGLSPDPAVQRWQRRVEPIAKGLFQGLYLTRDIPTFILNGGFQIQEMETGYVAEFPKALTYCWCGTATKKAGTAR
jgi:ubiquinone/menaquinone biosynthesis C-methylase UbiE